MDNSPLSGVLRLIGLGVCILLFLAVKRFFPSLAAILLGVAGIILILMIALIAFVIFLAFHRPKEEPKAADKPDGKAILSKGHSDLMEIRSMSVRVRNQRVRSVSMEVCESADKILRTLREQPENLTSVRQFFNYYLPTFGSILSKYMRMEMSGLPAEEMTEKVVSCLGDIHTAMDKQYQSLFDDDILDLTVEMETLTLVCKKDGLMDEDPFEVTNNKGID